MDAYYCSSFIFLIFFTINYKRMESYSEANGVGRILDMSSLNNKVVGIMLKTEGKRYFVSSELCPGGIFLPKPVQENCLCYNGIFQLVRKCCNPDSTGIFAENLEWRMDYKCGSSTGEIVGAKPIRAILPLTKAYNRFGSLVMSHSFSGTNVSQWHRFDTDDIIMRNKGEVRMSGRRLVEIVNVKPLGRSITIWFGEKTNVAVCYSGWFADFPQSLRLHVKDAEETKGCCYPITKTNIPGDISSNCSIGSIFAELIDIPTADIDIGKCEQDVTEDAMHKLRKRNPTSLDIFPFQRDMFPFDHQPSKYGESTDDVLGDVAPIIFKRETRNDIDWNAPINVRTTRQDPNGKSSTTGGSTLTVILPRRRGIATATSAEQQRAINEFISIIRNDPLAEIHPPKTFRFQLLRQSFDVFLAVVPDEIVPHIMLKTAFDIFYFLYEGLEALTHNPPEMHQRAMQFLDKCMKNSKKLNFTTYGCPRLIDQVVITPEIKAKLELYYKGKPDELKMKLDDLKNVDVKKSRRFIPEKFDIYTEINWKVVDFVHSFCFDHFSDEFNAHHFYEKELETIFLYREVQQRWYTKRPNKLKYVRGIFPVTQLEQRMKQLDKVVSVGHHLSRYNGTYWLYRPLIDPFFVQSGLSPRADSSENRKKLIFSKNVMDEFQNLAETNSKISGMSGRELEGGSRISSEDRQLIYPFQIPEKLPAGELIWDGRAVCLHASYSNKQNYFTDSSTWGVSPSLPSLGKMYPLEI